MGIAYHEGVYLLNPKYYNKLVKLDQLLRDFKIGYLETIPLYPVGCQVEMITDRLITHIRQKISETRENLSIKKRAQSFAGLNNDMVDMQTLVEDYKTIVSDTAALTSLRQEMSQLANEIALKL